VQEVDFKLEAQRTAQFADFLLGRPELQEGYWMEGGIERCTA